MECRNPTNKKVWEEDRVGQVFREPERTCNLEGQYITFEADFSEEATPYEKSICIIGVMGSFCDEEGINCTDEQETETTEQD